MHLCSARKYKYSCPHTRKNLHACVKQRLWVINPRFCRHAARDHMQFLSSGQCAAFLSSLLRDHFVMWHLWDTHSTQWRKQRDGHAWKGHTTGIAGYAAPCVCTAWGSAGDLRLNASAKGTLWKGCSAEFCCKSSQQQVGAESYLHGCTQGRCCKQDFCPQYRGYIKSVLFIICFYPLPTPHAAFKSAALVCLLPFLMDGN